MLHRPCVIPSPAMIGLLPVSVFDSGRDLGPARNQGIHFSNLFKAGPEEKVRGSAITLRPEDIKVRLRVSQRGCARPPSALPLASAVAMAKRGAGGIAFLACNSRQ